MLHNRCQRCDDTLALEQFTHGRLDAELAELLLVFHFLQPAARGEAFVLAVEQVEQRTLTQAELRLVRTRSLRGTYCSAMGRWRLALSYALQALLFIQLAQGVVANVRCLVAPVGL